MFTIQNSHYQMQQSQYNNNNNNLNNNNLFNQINNNNNNNNNNYNQQKFEQGKQLLFHLSRVIDNHQSTLENVFLNFNKFDINTVDFTEFGVMLRKIDSSLQYLDLQILFSIFDQSNYNKISFLTFKNIFKKFYEQYQIQKQQELQNLSLDLKLDYNNQVVTNFALECERNRTNLTKLFTDFLLNQNDRGLGLEQFGKMLLKMNPNLQLNEIKKAFEVFDLQQDNNISLQEFQTTIQRFSTQTRGIYLIIQEIKKHNIDLQLFFNNFNKADGSIIDTNEFSNMVKRIIPELNNQQIELIFRRFDTQGSRQFTFQRFRDIIHKYFFEDTVPNTKTEKAIEKLVKEIKKSNITPQQIFDNYDRQHDTRLDVFEFGILLRKIDQSLTEREINLAFDKFDIDKDKSITFKEFVDTLAIVYQINIQPFERKTQAVQKLTLEIINSGQNLDNLFQEIDQSKDKQLDIFEFGSLLRKIDPNLQSHEIELAFEQFDFDGDRNISYQEFQTTLESIYEEQGTQITKSKQAITKLINMVKSQNIDILALFREYDSSGDSVIDGPEFVTMMKTIDNTLNDSELQDAFHEFDQDRDGTITFEEFQNTITKYYTQYGQASL